MHRESLSGCIKTPAPFSPLADNYDQHLFYDELKWPKNCITFESSLHPFLDRYRLRLQGLLRPAQLTAQQVARRCGSGAGMLDTVFYGVGSRSTRGGEVQKLFDLLDVQGRSSCVG